MSYTDEEMRRDLNAIVRSAPGKGSEEMAETTLSETISVVTGRIEEELDGIEYRRDVLGFEPTSAEVIEQLRSLLQRVASAG